MLGGARNRGKYGDKACQYGCCRTLITGNKNRTRRILRKRESKQWKKEIGE